MQAYETVVERHFGNVSSSYNRECCVFTCGVGYGGLSKGSDGAGRAAICCLCRTQMRTRYVWLMPEIDENGQRSAGRNATRFIAIA